MNMRLDVEAQPLPVSLRVIQCPSLANVLLLIDRYAAETGEVFDTRQELINSS